jgi:hypothetical protein
MGAGNLSSRRPLLSMLRFLNMPRKRRYPPLKERLLRATSVNENGCWICTISISASHRYGWVNVDGAGIAVPNHRASWIVHRGPIPKGQCVLHTCDTPACINPDHLFLGCHADNAADREAKGRSADRKGEKNTMAFLEKEQVLEIRSLWATGLYTLKQIGEMFGTSRTNVNSIVQRHSWKHV